MNFATGRTAIMKYFIFIGSIIIAAIAFSWSFFPMPTIEDSSYICRLYSPEEYQEILSYDDLDLADLSSGKTIKLDLQIEFPFSVPEDAVLLVDVFWVEAGKKANIYYAPISPAGKIQVNVPAPTEYPYIYDWEFVLFVPSKSAICVWGLEEYMRFADEDFPRSWRIKLLTYRFEKETGGGRTTIFEPI